MNQAGEEATLVPLALLRTRNIWPGVTDEPSYAILLAPWDGEQVWRLYGE